MPSTSEDPVRERIAAVIAHLRARLGDKPDRADLEYFVRLMLQRMAPEEAAGRSVENLYGASLSLWRFAEARAPGEPRIRVYNPKIERDGWGSPHTVVDIVNDDMPFLVDSVGLALTNAGHELHLLLHPIVETRRDAAGKRGPAGDNIRESVMHVEIGQVADTAALEAIAADLERALADVRAAVADWQPMQAALGRALRQLEETPPPLDPGEVAEAIALLRWMGDNNFTFLGYREYDYRGGAEGGDLRIVAGSGLGILRRPEHRVMGGRGGFNVATEEVQRFLKRRELLIVTKANARSTIHRAVPLDYIGVRRFDEAGEAIGEWRFIGLFTSSAYSHSPRDIPLLRRKVRKVIERAGLAPQSYDAKALLHILDSYPRDELFQISENDLFDIATGVLPLETRPRIRVFPRRDEFGRFVSCLVYVPRERYDSELGQRFAAILGQAFHGEVGAFHIQIGDEPLARLHVVIATPPDAPRDIAIAAIESKLQAAARLWPDDLKAALAEKLGEADGNRLFDRFSTAFPAAYRDRYDVATALFDISKIETLSAGNALAVNLAQPLEAGPGELTFKLYHLAAPVPLSDCLPVLEHMGFRVIEENPFQIARNHGATSAWIHEFRLEKRDGAAIDLGRAKDKFETAFERIWHGAAEDDRFNRLVLEADLDWREVWILRAYCKYLRQIGALFSQAYMEDALFANGAIAALLIRLFHARFDPANDESRAERAAAVAREVEAALDRVESLDEDRILRRYKHLIEATLRTNFYLAPQKPYLALKLASTEIEDLPLPRPMVEIFVHSPSVEAIHLRGGKVARGGIRWSDRREDFRTEILGLMKAQMVKNAVIVPVGAKGGFVPKRPPFGQGRAAVQADAIACYQDLIRGLLDLTDNFLGQRLVPPTDVVRHDDDDPYLVVAADKGTATFSDIANGIAKEYGYWLGDAFASGGSAGYDHKKMGITARGAYEMVKRHFREIGVDLARAPITAVGIGDMSGDVFGNGMLLVPKLKLVAAFDHRHVFLDPDPDIDKALAERRRLFELPASSWADYDQTLISKGGGVFERKLKTVPISPEVKARFGIAADHLTPLELIRALLTAEVDLLWNGGIGTYVKASGESHAEVGDRANDGVRVNGADLRAKVVGEGGNLGFTQRGRIEYAAKGGRINTDALDNSAGVDTSDHEVNIKILLDSLVAEGELTEKQRNALLQTMTDEIAALVLRDNYLQGQAVSLVEAEGARALPALERLMRGLEQAGKLDRAVEFLPDTAEVAARAKAGQGLTRPEIAVLLAYAKTSLYGDLLASGLPEDAAFAGDLANYFPRELHERFGAAIKRHRLGREIVATAIANSVVNRAGPGFIGDVAEETEAPPDAIARAYVIARDVFELRRYWREVEVLDNKVPAAHQTEMLRAANELLRAAVLWFLRQKGGAIDIVTTVAAYAPGIAALREDLRGLLGEAAPDLGQAAARLAAEGVPEWLANAAAAAPYLAAAPAIVDAATTLRAETGRVGRVFFSLGHALGLDWLRQSARSAEFADYWQRLAAATAAEDLTLLQRDLTIAVLEHANGDWDQAIAEWRERRGAGLARLEQLVEECRLSGNIDAARLAIANRHLQAML